MRSFRLAHNSTCVRAAVSIAGMRQVRRAGCFMRICGGAERLMDIPHPAVCRVSRVLDLDPSPASANEVSECMRRLTKQFELSSQRCDTLIRLGAR
jgi:hypothetical protein